MSQVAELYGISTGQTGANWVQIANDQYCPFLNRRCLKIRKSLPDQTIGSCVVQHGRQQPRALVICPHRFLAENQVFNDCVPLLRNHAPHHDLHVVSEFTLPGGNVDYFLISANEHGIVDFVGIELQALDTIGTVWPARQAYLASQGVAVEPADTKPYGINWKMTAKTTLVQLLHKLKTFESLDKHLVLVVQDHLLAYMQEMFNLSSVLAPGTDQALVLHSYRLDGLQLAIDTQHNTDSAGVTAALELQADPHVTLESIVQTLESRIDEQTRFLPGSHPKDRNQ